MSSEIKFSEIAQLRRESVHPANFADSKYVGLEHISQGTLQLNGYGFGSDVDSQKQRFYKGDVLFGKLRPYFRKVVKAPFDGICSTDIWVVHGKNPADNDFIKYWMASQSFIDSSTGAAEGSRMPRAQWDWVSEFTCPIMSASTRHKIGTTLAKLDEKIRVNQQIASTLEQIAQTIFKSWFVDFDPVHAKARGEQPVGMDAETAALFPDSFEESELGPIPSGWQEKSLGDVCDLFDNKRVPLAKDVRASRPGPFPYYGATGALDAIDDFIFDGIYVLVAEDGTVMTAEGTPVIQYVWGKFWVSNHAHILKGRDSMSDEQLMLLLQRVKLEQYVTGAVQMKVSQGNLKSIPVTAAPYEINSCFSKLIEPLYAQIRTLRDQNQSLTSIRDSLLPRLISGELEIPAELLEV
jgi:type I restriction enzyme S subunit